MRLLLDTHVLIWAATAPERLGSAATILTDADVRLVSAASVWEMAVKSGVGKLDLGADVGPWVDRAIRELVAHRLPISTDHAAAVEALPAVHRDPFDRMLVAQARCEDAVLLTADPVLARYGPPVLLI